MVEGPTMSTTLTFDLSRPSGTAVMDHVSLIADSICVWCTPVARGAPLGLSAPSRGFHT